ncbi:hypothetical protein C2E20_3768 [Micractinium conductrix]|uniref:DRBM domain-containing protein n=1 Tax=Micractinium conductrix TaxID=554055 RepID=A0A2P6VGH6_9CHLO|nr:hypothetical protein C2E20_3768 [Micractinium conductrix]|eukprot:PSC73173.1 hypothetical protein C2E20_3768 [Micractinium conductrix]
MHHHSSRSTAGVLPGAPAIRSPEAHTDCRTPLKELLDHYKAAAHYAVEKVAGAPASEPLQFACSLSIPDVKKPGSDEVLLPACSFSALGRGKADAEERCARQALAHIAKAAPALGAKEP